MVEWMVPLVTSSVRLVVIFVLLLCNVVALWHTTIGPKYRKGPRAYERVFLKTVICLNMIYLIVIWGPFTVLAFRHDFMDFNKDTAVIHDMQHSAPVIMEENIPELAVQYIDMYNGQVLTEKMEIQLRVARATHEKDQSLYLWSTSNDTEAVGNYSSQPSRESVSQLATEEKSDARWNTDVQDLETSSFAYSLALTAIFRLIIARRSTLRPSGSTSVAIASSLLVVMPVFTTGLIRLIGKTMPLLALHKPEMTNAGFTIRSIICDVFITEAYVLSLFLEWAAVFTLAIAVLVLSFTLKSSKTDCCEAHDLYEEGVNCSSVDTLACDFVLLLGACWAWPVKPLLGLVLYCQYGQHWSNVVCSLAHIVVAIPVVFIPLAVFVSRQQKNLEPPHIDVLIVTNDMLPEDVDDNEKQELDDCKDANNTKEGHTEENICTCNEIDGSCNLYIVKTVTSLMGADHKGMHKSEASAVVEKNSARDNLKFYLGTDILKNVKKSTPKEDDKCMILQAEWCNSDSEV